MKVKIFGLVLIFSLMIPVLLAAKEKESLWEKYKRFWAKELDKVERMELWGVTTTQLPKGYFSIKYKWGTLRASEKYDSEGNKGPIFPPIEFPDIFDNSKTFLSFDIGIKGQGGPRMFQMSYGITDPLDFYLEIPFQFQDIWFTPIFIPGTCATDDRYKLLLGDYYPIEDLEDFYRLIEGLGRPRPKHHWRSDGWELEDMHSGFSWNYYKGNALSTALTARVFFPTAQIANPNNSIIYFTGPHLDPGDKCWGIGFTHGLDFRFPNIKFLAFGSEISAEYRFESKRKYPDFPKPDPQLEMLRQIINQEAAIFPDLSDLSGKEYTFQGDPNIDINIGVGVYIFYFAYSYAYSWGMKFKSDSKEFTDMVKEIGLTGKSSTQAIRTGIHLPLIFFYIPCFLDFSYERNLKGKDVIIFEDYWAIETQWFLPIGLL